MDRNQPAWSAAYLRIRRLLISLAFERDKTPRPYLRNLLFRQDGVPRLGVRPLTMPFGQPAGPFRIWMESLTTADLAGKPPDHRSGSAQALLHQAEAWRAGRVPRILHVLHRFGGATESPARLRSQMIQGWARSLLAKNVFQAHGAGADVNRAGFAGGSNSWVGWSIMSKTTNAPCGRVSDPGSH